MEAYAVIGTGGKQYRVQAGDTLKVEILEGEAGSAVTLESVLALSNGTDLKVGTPFVKGAKVVAEIVERTKGPKVVAYKKKRRKGYSRKVGHRQPLTVLRVTSIG
ncbi:MAG: 50S ribosomal protein L21 [bacterium]